jgi:hypothetical protein
MPVLLHAASEHDAVEDIQRGKQGRGAMPLIVVRHGAAAAFLQRQARLRAVECLDLALFVDRQDDRVPKDASHDRPLGRKKIWARYSCQLQQLLAEERGYSAVDDRAPGSSQDIDL